MKSLDYQESTKRSWERIRANPHSLDFANMPQIYSDVARQPLSTDLPDSAVPTLAALAEPGAHAGDDRAPGRNELARLLSAVGITKRRRYPGGEILFRGASCTGALYHIEVYVVCADLKELPAGVYQFQPKDFSLCLLRAGDCRQALDDDATAFFSPHTAGKSVMFLTTVGRPGRPYAVSRTGKLLSIRWRPNL